jgi:hypothetical protein
VQAVLVVRLAQIMESKDLILVFHLLLQPRLVEVAAAIGIILTEVLVFLEDQVARAVAVALLTAVQAGLVVREPQGKGMLEEPGSLDRTMVGAGAVLVLLATMVILRKVEQAELVYQVV